MPRFGPQLNLNGAPCAPQDFMGYAELPNCDDPVFRAWCSACGLRPGGVYERHDARLAMLEELMQGHDPSYDPEQDHMDDYLTRGLY